MDFPGAGGRAVCRRHRPRSILHRIARRLPVCGRAAGDPVRHRVSRPVHHAETIAHRIGEPYGTLLLTLAVTIIEVALIATIMLGGKAAPALARDTVFAVVMIVCNGLVGICILTGGLRYREQEFQVAGASLYLSVLVVLATITLIMPDYTLTTPGPFLFGGSARLRQRRHRAALRRVPLYPDHPATAAISSAKKRGRTSARSACRIGR